MRKSMTVTIKLSSKDDEDTNLEVVHIQPADEELEDYQTDVWMMSNALWWAMIPFRPHIGGGIDHVICHMLETNVEEFSSNSPAGKILFDAAMAWQDHEQQRRLAQRRDKKETSE